MEIIFVCTKAITFNTFLKSQANYFLKNGFKVKVACSDIENLDHRSNHNHRIIFPTKLVHLFNIFLYLRIFLQIKNLIKENKSSIFYLHTPVASHLFRLFSISHNLKIIYLVHGFRFTSQTKFLRAFFFKTIEKILSFKTKIFITINNEDFNYAKNYLFKKTPTYKINGVGLDLKQNYKIKIRKKENIKKILIIGAYKKSKGYLEVLKIAKILQKRGFKIDCYGYGDYKKFQYIKIKERINNISFNKFDFNLKKKIRNYDILLHLSIREGLPVSVMECLVEGLPVICKNIRGTKDLIKDGHNGFFVNSDNEVPNKIFYLNLDKNYFNKMRYNAIRSITQDFSKKKINQKIYKIIKKHFN